LTWTESALSTPRPGRFMTTQQVLEWGVLLFGAVTRKENYRGGKEQHGRGEKNGCSPGGEDLSGEVGKK